MFNENKSCIEIGKGADPKDRWFKFNENKSCIEILKIVPLFLYELQFNENKSCIEIGLRDISYQFCRV